jgi:hypothetical protein
MERGKGRGKPLGGKGLFSGQQSRRDQHGLGYGYTASSLAVIERHKPIHFCSWHIHLAGDKRRSVSEIHFTNDRCVLIELFETFHYNYHQAAMRHENLLAPSSLTHIDIPSDPASGHLLLQPESSTEQPQHRKSVPYQALMHPVWPGTLLSTSVLRLPSRIHHTTQILH